MELSHRGAGGSQRGGSFRGGSQRGGSQRGGSKFGGCLGPGKSSDHTFLTARSQAALARISYLSRPTATFEVELVQDVRALRDTCYTSDGCMDLVHLASDLGHLGYACHVQRNDPTKMNKLEGIPACGMDTNYLEKLRHEFLVCTGRSDGSLQHHCLIDPQFRDQFAIGQPTEQYNMILDAVPEEFVGSALRLQSLVNALSTEVAMVYEEQGLPLPPWRKFHAVLGRWFDVDSAASKLQKIRRRQEEILNSQKSVLEQVAKNGTGAASTHIQRQNAANNISNMGKQLADRASAGGTAQFHASVAMHQEALRLQSQRNNKKGLSGQSILETLEEPSNKPRRRKALQQEQHKMMQETYPEANEKNENVHSVSSPSTVCNVSGREIDTVGHDYTADSSQTTLSPSSMSHRRGGLPVWHDLATIVEAPSSSNAGSSAVSLVGSALGSINEDYQSQKYNSGSDNSLGKGYRSADKLSENSLGGCEAISEGSILSTDVEPMQRKNSFRAVSMLAQKLRNLNTMS